MSRHFLAALGVVICLSASDATAAKTAQPRRAPAKTARKSAATRWTPEAVNNPDLTDKVGPRSMGAAALRAQILLSRAHFSVGEIDGGYGDNMRKALLGFQKANGLDASGMVDESTWKALNTDASPVLTTYTVTEEDVNTKFVEIPKEMGEQAKLDSLNFQNLPEMLGERFHCSPALLSKLNPGKSLETPGTELNVPNVAMAGGSGLPKAASVSVSKESRLVEVMDASNKVLAAFPATIGSEHDPLPVGDWKVTTVLKNPPFYYNPALFWDAKPGDAKAKLPPGPNGPVGLVWIGLSKEHYGIHGTPEPGTIGHTESHGCIRLTNWDALTVADMVRAGIPVHLTE